MNAYTVVLAESAEKEFNAAYEWLVRETPQHAPIWYNGMIDALLSLETLPLRCPIAHDETVTAEVTRVLLYGRRQHAYRILFSVHEETVIVVHIRHAARN